MISPRMGLLTTVLTLGLTACGQSIAPSPDFNSGPSDQDYHGILMDASASGHQTYDRNGRLVAVAGPLSGDEDLPLEVLSSNSDPVELAARLDPLPIPAVRPAIEITSRLEGRKVLLNDALSELAPTPVLSELAPTPVLSELATTPVLSELATTPVLSEGAPTPALSDVTPTPALAEVAPTPALVKTPLLVPDSEVVAAAPAVTQAAFQPSSDNSDPTLGLSLLGASRNRALEAQAATGGASGTATVSTPAPVDTPAPQANANQSLLSADVLSLSDDQVDILLVQLEDEKSGLERVRSMTPEEKARLRSQYEKRSFLGHFARMDRSNDGALTREEMLAYFSIMHAAFDADYDNVVTRAEAPTLLLRIKLLGRGFPAEGLTLEELAERLDETFVFLDRNKNNKLGWPELL